MDHVLARLLERSGDLKGELIQFAESPRFERSLNAALLEAAEPGRELDDSTLIGVLDRFALGNSRKP